MQASQAVLAGSLAALASSRNPFTSWDNLGDFAIQVGSGSLAEDNFEAGLALRYTIESTLGQPGPSRAEGSGCPLIG